jgi:hypothetical protein
MMEFQPDEATFSRAFAEFTEAKLAERVHEALVKNYGIGVKNIDSSIT